jgi:hypothetical protein
MLALILLSVFIACVVPSLAALWLVPRSKPKLRYGLAVALFTLFVAPSFLAGGVLAVPVPFGAVLFASAADLQPTLVLSTLSAWPVWHAVTFPVTALIGALVFVRARPNNSFKPKPLRGSA